MLPQNARKVVAAAFRAFLLSVDCPSSSPLPAPPPRQGRALLSGLLDLLFGIMLAEKIINSDTI
nr:MAG TPA: hypothetical protein [Caudoviricetes sp.]